ncbi:hypothetical protein BJ741DRAFT_649610 [Chytriomyces cf. hyalinus JEL632]|nr:hypothetical protein BJ741DRAFT_649610 [Chytriomyces cf. hyalinus JEL632]
MQRLSSIRCVRVNQTRGTSSEHDLLLAVGYRCNPSKVQLLRRTALDFTLLHQVVLDHLRYSPQSPNPLCYESVAALFPASLRRDSSSSFKNMLTKLSNSLRCKDAQNAKLLTSLNAYLVVLMGGSLFDSKLALVLYRFVSSEYEAAGGGMSDGGKQTVDPIDQAFLLTFLTLERGSMPESEYFERLPSYHATTVNGNNNIWSEAGPRSAASHVTSHHVDSVLTYMEYRKDGGAGRSLVQSPVSPQPPIIYGEGRNVLSMCTDLEVVSVRSHQEELTRDSEDTDFLLRVGSMELEAGYETMLSVFMESVDYTEHQQEQAQEAY